MYYKLEKIVFGSIKWFIINNLYIEKIYNVVKCLKYHLTHIHAFFFPEAKLSHTHNCMPVI